MKKAIVFSSITGQTKKMAEAIKSVVGEVDYFGGPSDEALDADMIYVGSWAQAFTCTPDIKEFLEKLKDKNVFLFMTAGYGDDADFLGPIIMSMQKNVDISNKVAGVFIAQGEVSQTKQDAIKKMDMAKYESMKANLDKSIGCPSADSLEKLKEIVSKIEL